MASDSTINAPIHQDRESFVGTGYKSGSRLSRQYYYYYNYDKNADFSDTSSFLRLQKKRKTQLLQRIESIAALQDNWNGYGATSFSSEVLQRARSLVEDLVYKTKVFPTGRDSIQFEFDSIPGKYLEIEVFADHYAFLYEDGKIQEEVDLASREDVLKKVAAYHG
jgi:hypothetical protein